MCNNNGFSESRELEVNQQNVWEYIVYDEAIKSKNRNPTGGETLYDRGRETLATGIPLIDL